MAQRDDEATPPPGRWSTQQRAVLRVLHGARGFATVHDLYLELVHDGSSVSLATVYRTVRLLVASGAVEAVHGDRGSTAYRIASTGGSRLSLRCVRCGDVEPVSRDVVEEWARATAACHGFVDVGMVADLRGLCAACGP
ncbi:transcriptional repressor [Cellulosimicrobium sp. PMB13]|uniref:Fur family transcriptional regulator n=1 Tax=Cellulosimicrobium sp. PMB13 TaxID=3120158 RepID=UPI003F4BD779